MYSISLLKNILKNANKIAIVGHKDPDADSLASMVAIKKSIENNVQTFGKKIIHLFSDSYVAGDMYDPITKDEVFEQEINESYDLVISVDSPTLLRLGKFATLFENTNSINIDHHETNENYAKTNLIYKCSSTCELVFVLLKALNIEPGNDILKMLYAGIITDTVNLTQGTVKVSSYKIVAEIAEKLNDISALNAIKDHFLKNNSKSNVMLLEKALHSMRFYLDDKVAIMKITKEDQEQANASQADTVGIVNHAINVKGVSIAIIFVKKSDGKYYVSIRGKNGVDVTPIATAFGGGGHDSVAAFEYYNKLSAIKNQLLDLCKAALENIEEQDETVNLFDE